MTGRIIYLDMDGVLADFDAAMAARGLTPAKHIVGTPRETWTPEQAANDDACKAIMSRDDFWPSIPLMKGALDLYSGALVAAGPNGHVRLLSALPHLASESLEKRVVRQKVEWAVRALGVSTKNVHVVERKNKALYAGGALLRSGHNILIDDMPLNCQEWEKAGGKAHVYTSSEAALDFLLASSRTPCVVIIPDTSPAPAVVFVSNAPPATPPLTADARRKAQPVATGVLDYFPDALLSVSEVSKAGNEQHNPGKAMAWDKTKSTDHANSLMRHFLERGTRDSDGQRHSAKVAWRALALLQTEIDTGKVKGPYTAPKPA